MPDSFCDLTNLKKLQLGDSTIGGCEKLESLPERFGELRSLVTLNLDYCSMLALPEGLHVIQTRLMLTSIPASTIRPEPPSYHSALTRYSPKDSESCQPLWTSTWHTATPWPRARGPTPSSARSPP